MFKKAKSKKILAFFLALILILPLVSYSKPVNVLGTQTEETTANITKTAVLDGDETERIYKLSFTADLR